jgi:hypothetical protein
MKNIANSNFIKNKFFNYLRKGNFCSTKIMDLEVIQSKIDKTSQEYQVNKLSYYSKDNYQNIKNQVNILDYHILKILECGGKVSNERHLSRGKLMVRDRINEIIDKG